VNFGVDRAHGAGAKKRPPTKKETIRTGLSRFYAFVSALFISFFCYKIFGFSNTAFFVYTGFFIVICQIFGWYSAIAMDSVLISHFILFGKMGFYELRNEILLFAIGVGFGVLMNLFLTNGGKAIPIVVFLDLEDKVLAHWGSRPSVATKMVEEEKAKNGKLSPEFKEELQRWYNQDKGATIVDDFKKILETI